MQQVSARSPELLERGIHTLQHDLRNRLGALKLELYMLERKASADLKGDVDIMKEEIGEINHMIDDLEHYWE